MRRLRAQLLGFALAAVAMACSAQEGTISVAVVSAPGGDLLSRIDRLQATFTSGGEQFGAKRDDDGTLDFVIDLKADGRSGDLVLEGFDEAGARIAVGRVGPLPLAAVDASVSAFLAPPNSITQAPVSLPVPRSHIGGTETSFGALLAGGLGDDGPVGDVNVYSTYLHDLQSGRPLPEPRSSIAVTTGTSGFIYMLGGDDEEGLARAESYVFDTRVPPAGSYRPLAIAAEHARSGASTTIVGSEQFLVSGNPVLLLDGLQSAVRPLLDGNGLDGPAATVIADNRLQVIFGGAGIIDPELGGVGAALYDLDTVTHLTAPPELVRTGHRAIGLLTQEVLFLGGATEDGLVTTSAVLYQPTTSSFRVIDFLATGRRNPAVAMTSRHLVIAGGEDDAGNAIADAEVFNALTLEPITTLSMVVPRKNAVALALNNGQVLIAGGQDDSGAPTGLLGLFTPDETP